MHRRSVVAKLWLAFTVLILVVLVPLEFALDRLLTDFYAAQVTEPLLYHSQQLATMIATDPNAVEVAPMMGKMVGGEVMVLDPSGRVLVNSGPGTVPQPPLPALQAGLSGATYTGKAGNTIVTAVPVAGVGGAVLLFAPADPLDRSLRLARRYLWLAGAGTLLIGTGLAFMLSRSLLRPVIAIEHATREIARGDFSTRVEVASADELGKLAGAVNQMTAQLEVFENRRREFLANVAHELRTPLSYIRGYTQAMAEGLIAAPEERERYQRIVHEESIRVGRLVDDLMDLAQMDEGQLSLGLVPLDLRVPAEQAAAIIRPLAEEKGVSLDVSLPDGLPALHADGDRIQQVLFNLLDNGVRHTPAGGKVTISAKHDSGGVTVRVADTGPGIAPELLPLVFERFHKWHSGGRGLGLAIVRSIIRAHGGEVGAESFPGEGAVLWFRLPKP